MTGQREDTMTKHLIKKSCLQVLETIWEKVGTWQKLFKKWEEIKKVLRNHKALFTLVSSTAELQQII